MVDIFRSERDAGLEAIIRNSSSTAYAAALSPSRPFPVPAPLSRRAHAGQNDEDLAFFKAVLVSTVWNNNDDVFEPLETWNARATPLHKPLNIGHLGTDIVGHIVTGEVVDDAGNVVPEDTAADNLPELLHIQTGAVVYRYWEDQAQQKRVDELLSAIADGKKAVSMECFFNSFDYALKGPDGKVRVVPRTSDNADLSKNLKAYGGAGLVGNERIGRVLRGVRFVAKAIVDKPANPASFIVARAEAAGDVVEDISSYFGITEAKLPEIERAVAAGATERLHRDVLRYFGILEDSD